MKLNPPDKRTALSALRAVGAVTVLALLPLFLYGSAPSWWIQRGVLVENAAADDYAPANQGQLKNIANAAAAEMDARLTGGAGDQIHSLISSWSTNDPSVNDFAPINLGQLKNVARPFYDRLIAAGLLNVYPWLTSLNSPDDFAVANIGQVKNLFAFEIPSANAIDNPDSTRLAAGPMSVNLAVEVHAVWSWGDHFGTGSEFERNIPRRLTALAGISSVSAGERHLAVLRNDGSVSTWGENTLGQLGDGSYSNRNVPAIVPALANVSSLRAGGLHTLALQQDGTVVAWGDNYYGQLGTGDRIGSPIPTLVAGLDNVRKVAAGYQRSVALKNDGTVWTWGYDHYAGQDVFTLSPTAVPELSDIIDVAAGYEHVVAVKADGTVWAWGSNYANQIGNGNPWWKSQDVPVQVPSLGNVVKVASSYDHTLVLANDGTVWSWGYNFQGQLGDGTTQPRPAPVRVSGLTDVIAIATAYSYSLAMKSDGTVWAWGDGAVGTLPGADLHVPQLVGLGLLDTNHNGMDDRWEMQFLGNLNESADGDLDGDGISNRLEYLRGTDPADYFNGVTPVLEVVSGNNQIGDPGTFLNKPFKVRVKNAAGQILINAPVHFSISGGLGAIAAALNGVQAQSLDSRTDTNGEAFVYHSLPGTAGVSTRTTASAGSSAAAATATFRGIVRFTLPATPTPAPTPPDPNVTPTPPPNPTATPTPPDPNATPTPTPSPTATPVAPYRYAIIDLGKDMYPLRLNNQGQILMKGYDSNGNWSTFRWKGGTLERLTYAATNDQFDVDDFNDAGVVVGSFPEIGPWKNNKENEVGAGLVWPPNISSATKISAPSAYPSFKPQLPGTFRWARLGAINNAGDFFGQICTGSVRGTLSQTLLVKNSAWWAAGVSPPVKLGNASAANTPPDSDTSTWQGSIDTITRANVLNHYIGRRLTPFATIRDLEVRGIQTGMIDGQSVSFNPIDINEAGIVVGSAGADMVVSSSPTSRTTISGASPLAINDHTRPAPSPLPQSSPSASPSPTPIPIPQILAWAGDALVIWERQDDGKTWHPFGLEEMIPSMDGWEYIEPYDINDTGAIIGTGWYVDPSNPHASGENHAFMLVPVELVPDFNRNGVIDITDRGKVSENSPWRWWVNDDDNSPGDIGHDGDDIPGAAHPDGQETTVQGIRDLIDYFPLYLDIGAILRILPPSQGTVYRLRQDSGSLRFVYTDLTPDTIKAYLTSFDGDQLTNATSLSNAPAIRTTSTGVVLDPEWLNKISDERKGVLLFEGRDKSSFSLILEVIRDGQKVLNLRLALAIDSVEKMFRHINLTGPNNEWGGRGTETDEPLNYPDTLCGESAFVFVHGFNVTPEAAKGWNAQMFKRLQQAGSKAKFYGITWYGAEMGDGLVVPDYHKNVDNAFATAQPFAEFINGLPGNVTVTAHSLGNIVVGSAIHDWGAEIANYCMVDSAVALEAYDGAASKEPEMVQSAWNEYPQRVWASEWYNNPALPAGDSRRKLTWRDRLSRVGEHTYNFYASSEDVLRIQAGDPSLWPDVTKTQYQHAGLYAWALQEKLKGLKISVPIIGSAGSAYGGWQFTHNHFSDSVHVGTPSAAASQTLTDQSLITDPVFDPGFSLGGTPPIKEARVIHADSPGWIADLTDAAKGNSVAERHGNQLLAEAFPARTLPAGANALRRFQGSNFNMPSQFITSKPRWPRRDSVDDVIEWRHSDVKEVAYPHLYQLFKKWCELGGLTHD